MPKVLDKIMGYKPSGYNRKRLCLPLWKGEDAYVKILGLLLLMGQPDFTYSAILILFQERR